MEFVNIKSLYRQKEKYLEQLITGDESYYNADPDEYATSHMAVLNGLLISKCRRADDAFLLHPALCPEL